MASKLDKTIYSFCVIPRKLAALSRNELICFLDDTALLLLRPADTGFGVVQPSRLYDKLNIVELTYLLTYCKLRVNFNIVFFLFEIDIVRGK